MTAYDDGPLTDWRLVQSGDLADAIDHLANQLMPPDRAVPKMSTCVVVEVGLRDIAARIRDLEAEPPPVMGEYFMADPTAMPAFNYNTVGERLTPELLEQALQDMWGYGVPCGAPSFSWWRRPPRRVNLFRLRGEWARQLELSAWREAGRSAWIEGVRERLQSAVYAASSGYGWSWTAPGVFGVPGLPESLQVRHAGQPWRPTDDTENVDD